MQVQYSLPFDHAWKRMKGLLFQPFHPGTWFVLGFTAWLAELAGGYPGGASEKIRVSDDWNGPMVRDWFHGQAEFVRSGFEHPLAYILAGMVLVAILVLGVFVLWISSRGRFMFLDNLVHTRSEIQAPWTAFAAQGDSLFLWQVAYSVIAFVVMGSMMGGAALMFLPVLALEAPLAATLPLVILAGTAGFILIVTLVCIEFFLAQFVVPIMYQHRISATEAWKIFLPLFREHPGSFILFGLLYFAVMTVGAIAYLAVGLMTCCAGLIMMAIPYLGTVITLPLLTLGRYLSLDFLGQFGDDFRLLQPLPTEPGHPYGSAEVQGDGTVVGPEDISQDPGTGQTGPQGG
jgi:uncharacterized membrane protein